ncbi:MAG: hypothetical protein RIS64_3435, partial [Bacteroidota bacterium]
MNGIRRLAIKINLNLFDNKFDSVVPLVYALPFNCCVIHVVGTHLDQISHASDREPRDQQVRAIVTDLGIEVPVHCHEVALCPIEDQLLPKKRQSLFFSATMPK